MQASSINTDSVTMPHVVIIGVPPTGLSDITTKAKERLMQARFGFTAGRHHSELSKLGQDQIFKTYPRPLFPSLLNAIEAEHQKKPYQVTTLLATGDPMWFGIGASLARRRPEWRIESYPSIAVFQLAASRLSWPLDQCHCLSIHGRSPRLLLHDLHKSERFLIIGSSVDSPRQVATVLDEYDKEGAAQSSLWVLEHLAEPQAHVSKDFVPAWKTSRKNLSAWHCIALEWRGRHDRLFASVALRHDDHDGNITQEPLRALAMQYLNPRRGATLWDVGAGNGSIAMTWCLAGGNAVCYEAREDRVDRLRNNLSQWTNSSQVSIFHGHTPKILNDPACRRLSPDAIFIGGGLSSQDGWQTLAICHDHLKQHGQIIAHAISLRGEENLIKAFNTFGGRLQRFSWQEAAPINNISRISAWTPHRPVTIWHYSKD